MLLSTIRAIGYDENDKHVLLQVRHIPWRRYILLLKQLKLESIRREHGLKHLDHMSLAIKTKYSSHIYILTYSTLFTT